MIEKILPYFNRLVLFSLILFALQYYLVKHALELDLYYSTFAVYAFHFLSAGLLYLFLLFVHKNYKDKTGFAFMGASLVKMLAAILFLLPVMMSEETDPLAGIFAFFIPFFLYLIFETIYAIKLINSK